MEHITLWNLLAFLFIALGPGFVKSTIGFGFAIIALPFIVMILPLKQSVAILSILGTLCYIRNTYKLRKDIDMKIVMIPLVASMAGRVLGMQFLMGSEGEYIKIFLGFSFVVLAIYFAFYKNRVQIQYTVKNGLIFGFISGVFGGMFNISGPPIVLYFMAGNLSKERYMANLQLYFMLATLFSVMLHILYGNVVWSTVAFSGVGYIGVLIGSIIGLKVFHKMNVNVFNKAVYIFLAVSGIYTIITSAAAVL
ncbi:MAG: sulfite exporter TauE/SafE family protein [Clostridiaceae bacterium]|nr:sulfite exporter TauE/SafE family protein [Clostridiaceae bacterium]